MKNPLIINIRCSCIEEYINIQRLHKEYTRQLRTGEIMSVFVGAELAVPGEYAVVDKLMEKGGQCRKVIAGAFYPKVKVPETEEERKALKEGLDRALTIVGPQPDESIELPQAVDGGVDAMGNPPLPEKPLAVDEVRDAKPDFIEREVVFDPNVEDYRAESEDWKASHTAAAARGPNNFEPRPEMVAGAFPERFPNGFIEEPVPDTMFKKVPETLTEPDFTQAEPSVAEESDDGCNGEDRNYTC